MKKILLAVIVSVMMVLSAVCIAADASSAKQDWLAAKDVTRTKQGLHQDAKLAFAADKTDENRQNVVDTGKDYLNAALDEAEAWLDWKNAEAEEDSRVPEEIKQDISDDVALNKDKIAELRTEVDGINSQAELGIVSLRMIGKYFELLTDVARNTGNMWAYVASTNADRIASYEDKLRSAAEGIDDNSAIIAKLDNAQSEIVTARENIQKSKDAYLLVKVGGTPFLKFSEGNSYLRAARANLINAFTNLNQAYAMINRAYAAEMVQ